ncbi:AAA family ATPase [Devosia sp. XK-2]|uniref:AAA family ATPase n=1 Tax=Devosia sp. XK-2 TaxID=3126689 RepID=UPI0030D02DF7
MSGGDTFVTLSSVKRRKVQWLWRPYIPFGMLTILEGDPGLGKSFLSMYLAAVVSTGGKLPDGQKVARGNVLYISAEDDPSYTTGPRIDALGGDSERIRVLNGRIAFDDEGLETLRAELDAHEPEVIIIDPWVSFVPADARIKDSNAVRALIDRIESVAKDYGCAVILIRHLTKMKHDNALYQGGGTIDMIAAARSALRIGKHPEREDHRVMAHLKHNVGPRGPTWVYELTLGESEDDIPRLRFIGTDDISVDDLNAGPDSARPRDAAEEFLRRELRDGPRKANEMKALADELGISERTLDRARSRIGVKSVQKKSGWVWSLPSG